MTVYVLIREDQNQHGYVDVSIDGIFREKQTAQECEELERRLALREGLRVCGDVECDGEWEVSWKIEEHDIT
jgi:hypothetical protein